MWEYRSYSELYHHGILGQKWGTRNGPPYPIPSGDHSALEKRKAAEARAERKENRRKEKQAVKTEKAEQKAKKKEENRLLTTRQKKIVAVGAIALTAAMAMRRRKLEKNSKEYKRELDKFTKIYRLDDLDNEKLKEQVARFEMRKKIVELGFGEGKATVDKGKKAASGFLREGLGEDIANDVVKKVATSVLSGAALYGAKAFASKTFSVKDFGEALFNGGPKKK